MCIRDSFYEPLWVFLGAGIEADRLSDLSGLRLAIGAEGSGTRAVASRLLERNGWAEMPPPRSLRTSVEDLLSGELDAVFLIAGESSPVVRRLLLSDSVTPFSFRRAEAYSRTDRFLARLTLPEGLVDYARNVPAADVELVAPTANLVVRDTLHPALVDLFVQSAGVVHGAGGVFEKPGEFPTPRGIDLPLDPEAHRYYEHGPPVLQLSLIHI